MAGKKIIRFEGKQYHFPSDWTDDQISEQLAAEHDANQPNAGLAPAAGNPRHNRVKEWEGGLWNTDPTDDPNWKPMPGVSEGANFADSLAYGVDQGPGEMYRGTGDLYQRVAMQDQTAPPASRSLHRIIQGGSTTAFPAVLAAAPLAPIETAAAIGLSHAGGKAGRYITKEFGGDEDAQNLGEDLGGLAGSVTGAKLAPSVIRGGGRILRSVAAAPDIPTDIPFMKTKATIASKALDASRSGLDSVGRKMSNYKIPQAPNVFPGEGNPPPDPDLPTPVRPSGQSHFDDVTDQGQLNKLLDEVNGVEQSRPRSGRPSVNEDQSSHYNDVSVPEGIGPEAPDNFMRPPVSQRPMPPSADDTPTPETDFIRKVAKSAPGWPENGQPNQPWENLLSDDQSDELVKALDTDPYNQNSKPSVDSPSYSGPERRQPGNPRVRPPFLYGGVRMDLDQLINSWDTPDAATATPKAQPTRNPGYDTAVPLETTGTPQDNDFIDTLSNFPVENGFNGLPVEAIKRRPK